MSGGGSAGRLSPWELAAAWWAERRWPAMGLAAGLALGGTALALAARPGAARPDGADLVYAAGLFALPALLGLAIDAVGLAARMRRAAQGLPDTSAAPVLSPDALLEFQEPVNRSRGGVAGLYERRMSLAAEAVRCERDARETELRRRADDLAAIVHEAKTPLAVVELAFGEFSRGPGAEAAPEFATLLRDELDRLAGTLERGLYLARADSFESDYLVAETDLRSVAAQTAARFSRGFRERGIAFRLEGAGRALTDAKWLAFVLAQLYSNALKYVPPGGSLEVSVGRGADAFWIEVADDGPGIAAEDLPRVFDRGFTGGGARAGASSGLGLHLARSLCERLGHRIEAGKRSGGGAAFRIVFPDLPDRPPVARRLTDM